MMRTNFRRSLRVAAMALILACPAAGLIAQDGFVSEAEFFGDRPVTLPIASPSPVPSGPLATVADAGYLNKLEKDIIAELNLVRANPSAYLRVVEDYANHYHGTILQFPGEVGIQTNEGLPAVRELAAFLGKAKPVGVLVPSPGLSRAAADHVRDQGLSGRTGHAGGDGSDMAQRINRYGTWGKSAGENIDYGADEARRIVLSLLVDDGVTSRGHRENIMNPAYRIIGVATGPHAVYGHMCVMDFAGQYQEK